MKETIGQEHIYNSHLHYDENLQSVQEGLNGTFNDLQEQQGEGSAHPWIKTGYEDLDKVLQGWHPSDYILVGGLPSSGKTSLVLNFARNAAVEESIPVLFLSLDMPASSLFQRLVVTESGLPLEKIGGCGKMEAYEWEALEYTTKKLYKAPLFVDDRVRLTADDIGAIILNAREKHGIRLVIVDSLNLVQAPDEYLGQREQEISAVSREFRKISKEQNIPIIATCQLNRDSRRRGGPPKLGDIRETSSLEYDADIVLLIRSNEEEGLCDSPEDYDRRDIIVAKYRNGATTDIRMKFKAYQFKFVPADTSLDVYASSVSAASSAMNDFDFNGASDF